GYAIAHARLFVKPAAHLSLWDSTDVQFEFAFRGKARDGIASSQPIAPHDSNVLAGPEIHRDVGRQPRAHDVRTEKVERRNSRCEAEIVARLNDVKIFLRNADAGEEVSPRLPGILQPAL